MLLVIKRSGIDSRLVNLRYQSLVIGFGFSIFALTIAVFASRRIVGPLVQITNSLEQLKETGDIGSLPVNSNDEMGGLAREFQNMFITSRLREKELLQQQFALDQHAIVSMTDVTGKIKYFNDKFVEISGYSAEELLGQDHRVLNSGVHSSEFFKQMYQTLVSGKVWENDICNKAKNGELYWVSTTIVPMMNDKGKPVRYISMRRDISANIKSSKELSDAKDELSKKVHKLQQANEDLDQFAYVASHDLKSPLNGIGQIASWLEEDCSDILPDESKEHLVLLRTRSQRMLKLLNDLLDYSRIGRSEHSNELVNLKEVTEDIFTLQGSTENFTCVAPSVELIVQRIPFEMVLRNLISNSIKHHDKQQGDIVVSYNRNEAYNEIRVTDDGPGIPPELHKKALEMFQTLKPRDEIEGSGMGLAMVSKMVEHHGGSLKIISSGGRGTTILIKWPFVESI